MMREIKFRGKRIDNGEWIYGNFTNQMIINNEAQKEYKPCIVADNFLIPVIPESVGQFTGLKDKNGKEIYEGDVLEIYDWGIIEVGYFNDIASFGGRTQGEFILNNFYGFETDLITKDIEVIGNINANTELIQQEASDPQNI